jgi:NAD(P)-dependent dehydrogenase (short-subunit alcohol dehydrogenase family)
VLADVADDIFLRNRNTRAVITGGSQGIGLAIARRLAREGAPAMVIAGRDPAKGEAAAEVIRALGAECTFVAMDVANAEDCVRLMDTAIRTLGTVNGLVNAAATSARGGLLDTTLAMWDAHMNTNVRGPFLLMQGLVRHLVELGAPGSIVNVLSQSAHAGQAFLTPYSTSKGALATLTKNVANAFAAQRIRCNGLMLGWMDTPGEHVVQQRFHGASEGWLAAAEAAQPMGQLVKPDQVASLAAYMLSPESGVMTGALVDYDQKVVGAYG